VIFSSISCSATSATYGRHVSKPLWFSSTKPYTKSPVELVNLFFVQRKLRLQESPAIEFLVQNAVFLFESLGVLLQATTRLLIARQGVASLLQPDTNIVAFFKVLLVKK